MSINREKVLHNINVCLSKNAHMICAYFILTKGGLVNSRVGHRALEGVEGELYSLFWFCCGRKSKCQKLLFDIVDPYRNNSRGRHGN